MAFPTVTNVVSAVQNKLGDDETPGDIYAITRLLPSIQHAVRDLFRAYQKVGNPRVIKNVYHTVPAYTSAISPATALIDDLGELMSVWARANLTTLSPNSVTPAASSIALGFAAAHGLLSGQFVSLVLPGVTNCHGLFSITVNSSTTLTVNGPVTGGTYTSGAAIVYSADQFWRLDQLFDTPNFANVGAGEMAEFAWIGDVLYVPPNAASRQLRIEYSSSATVPTAGADIIGVDDSIDFLASRAAALASKVRNPTHSASWNVEALGPRQQTDGSGGILRDLLQAGVRQLQNLPPEERTRANFRDTSEYVSG